MKRLTRVLLPVTVVIMLAAVYVFFPDLPEPTGPQGAVLYQPGELGMAKESLSLTDNTRPTMPNNNFAGQPFRELDGHLWFPQNAGQGPYPVILYSHGFMSSASEADYLAKFLVPKGYVIASVNYPLSNGMAPGGPTVNDVVNQAGDVSFVLDHLLARNSTEGDSLYGLIDAQRIAAAGLSLGGLTTQIAAFHRDARDPRIVAAASIAGPAEFLTPTFFSTSNMPFMMIAGTRDAVIPYEENALPILDKAPQSVLVSLEGGSHTGFARIASTLMRWLDHPDKLICPMLTRGLENGRQAGEPSIAPDARIGISVAQGERCAMTEFGRAMRPGEQQMLTRLAMYVFLESVFAKQPARRTQMESYLLNDLPREQSSITSQRSRARQLSLALTFK